jgi:hypothetical protein
MKRIILLALILSMVAVTTAWAVPQSDCEASGDLHRKSCPIWRSRVVSPIYGGSYCLCEYSCGDDHWCGRRGVKIGTLWGIACKCLPRKMCS